MAKSAKSLEERIEKVEQELERLKGQSKGAKGKSNWISDITGSFKDDEDFDEILRLGQEERRADRSDAKE